ncbi:glycerol-3-phosphate dehydrogenase/oxidase [Chitinophagales bacterium]|jgi:glycerol-3-phosphate dehydrogenase|nr:glycerol-3-phosphate dehydrogenase/oxidase [Chitinophagales bacterium]
MNTPFSFSSKDRLDFFAKSAVEFDLLVIGGGITGAGIALDASARGLKVALVEKHDFAWGTSSRSTKLIHGGLRYLKQLEMNLVKEVGQERAIVHCNARNLVIPEKMLLPIIKKGSLGVYTTSAALWVYDFLAGVKNKERRKMLDKENTRKSEPLLDSGKLLGGGLYYEYRTDDARLTIETIKKSVELGAYCMNYSEFIKPIYENAQLAGAEVKDLLTEKSYEIRAKCVVNATGPWVDLLRKKDNSLKGKRLQLTKGVHLVVPYERFPLKQAIYFDVKDGRMIFAIPRQGKTYIGTTDTVYNEDINEPIATTKDAKYILKAVNGMFPKLKLSMQQIESSWAGLRPLIHEDGKSPSELSRKDEIFISESGLISIAGGKLTGYRKMAERIVNRVVVKIGAKVSNCNTTQIPVFGANFQHNDEISELIIQLTSKNKDSGLNVEHIKEWVYRYGTETDKIIDYYTLFNAHNSDYESCALLAELSYGVDNEMVMSLEDFYIRRSAKLYFDLPNILNYLDEAGKLLCKKLAYSEGEMELQKIELKRHVALVTAFKN